MDIPLPVRYVVITAVRDEAQFAEKTIASVLAQTIPPVRWVIVDDGSRDETHSIISKRICDYDWIILTKRSRKGSRQPGSPVICAFNYGFRQVEKLDFDFMVKLDCDLELPADYFERLIAEFRKDATLGIASGIYLENPKGIWIPVRMPTYHAAGASKMFRRSCFTDIGGFIAQRGWDTVDEIRAQLKGWKTCHFEDLKFYHLKTEGAGIGPLSTNMMHGEVYYSTGGSKLFFILKVLDRFLNGKPFMLGGLAMLWGFLRCYVVRRKKLVTPEEARFYRQILNRRITRGLGEILEKFKPKREVWGQG